MLFTKMHGLGNDFVIIKTLHTIIPYIIKYSKEISSRKTGIGCDQIIIITNPNKKDTDYLMTTINADGSVAEICGNALRCVAQLTTTKNKPEIRIETIKGIMHCKRLQKSNQITVNMGQAKSCNKLTSQDIAPLKHILTNINAINVYEVNVGNPHLIIHTEDIKSINMAEIGPAIENHAMFLYKTNVHAMHTINTNTIAIQTWERGSGLTDACGSGACACAIALQSHMQQTTPDNSEKTIEVIMKGGKLSITIDTLHNIHMTGPATKVFTGRINLRSLKSQSSQ